MEIQTNETVFKKAKIFDIFKYSFGGLGSNLAFFLMMGYLTFFYTDIFGISSITVANIMLITRIFDAITDPLMGLLADRTKTKMGKYRPWIIAGAPLIGLLIFLLFSTPNLSPTAKVVYAYITYIAYSTFSDFVNIPYHSLTPVLSEDPEQRTLIVTAKQGMGLVAQIIVMIFALPLVNVFGGGQQGWSIFGAFIGLLTTLSFWICASGAKNYDLPVDKNEEKEDEDVKLKDQLFLITKNKPMITLMLAFGSSILSTAITNAVNIYFFVYVLNRKDLVPQVATITMAATLFSLLLLPRLSRTLGKKKTYIISCAACLIPFAILWFKPTMPIPLMFVFLAFIGFFQQISGNLGWAILPECVDYAEWKFGVRGNSTLTSAITFINKIFMALGGFIASLLLGVFGFIANQGQTTEVLNLIVFMRFGIPIFTFLISILSMSQFPLDEKKMREIRRDLTNRKNGQIELSKETTNN
ncbi:MFS transporter [Vagococcus elongatus]|uniref:Sugar (Glycoside-pentoside-Hexuronide) transporter n=1 Tax=Vagococcus elongatus TaxID=180344 RepID=A0A430B4E6_9ENTE|nr:glycoside-pentoside-hexuronide (GPH):cation symporter [Vagococcus elongatus]RSU15178.1 sugar (glycoside-pentoside-Hexuronide) transporter [Vagococcus elongatus]